MKNKENLSNFFSSYINSLSQSLKEVNPKDLEKIFIVLKKSIKAGSRIYTCGNGGSSSIAEHLACDFVKQASTDSKINPRVFPLLTTPILTALGNDISYDDIFSYQLKKYGEKKDILLSISSSGNSPNVIKAIKTAKDLGMISISFLGFKGGKAKKISDFYIHINSENYGICEDSHQILMHMFSQFLRIDNLEDDSKLSKLRL